MNVQILSLAMCFALTAAAEHHYRGAEHGHYVIDYHAKPHYEFEYSVHDPHTGDIKSQKEARKGDVVKGFYTLKEADGTIREVHYTADHKNGFNAVVKRVGHAIHPHHHHSLQYLRRSAAE